MRTKGSLRKTLALLIIVAVMATATETVSIRDSQQDRPSSRSAPLPIRFRTPAQAVTDFDGDRLPDRAELISNGFHKHIRLTLGSPCVTNLSFSTESPQPGRIRAEDIDHDSDNDLIWVSGWQPSHTALWLNNGIRELSRVSDPGAYATEIKRLVAGGGQNGSLATSVGERLRATETSGFYIPALADNHLPEIPHSTSPNSSGRSLAAALSPCVSRYPKRGPPSFLS